jgi:hypothetical protein
MSTPTQPEPATNPQCWCCGRPYPEQDLTRLGVHPEVGVCLGCAIYLKCRATAQRHEQQPTPASRARAGIDAVRNTVIHHGWPLGLPGALTLATRRCAAGGGQGLQLPGGALADRG